MLFRVKYLKILLIFKQFMASAWIKLKYACKTFEIVFYLTKCLLWKFAVIIAVSKQLSPSIQ